MSNSQTKLTVLLSGNGSNFQVLIDACKSNQIPNATIVRCISNRLKAYGRERARAASIPETYHNLVPYSKKYPSSELSKGNYSVKAREEYDSDLADLVIADRPDLVVCAGWMHIVSPVFLNKLESNGIKIINLHPGAPGGLAGADCIKRAWDAFQNGTMDKTGVMIHYVIPEVDLGEPIVSETVTLISGESYSDFEQRMHTVEYRLIVDGTLKAIDNIKKSEH